MCLAKEYNMKPIKSTGSKTGANMIAFFNRKGKLYVQFEANGKKYQQSTKLDDTPKNRTLVKKRSVSETTNENNSW